MDPLGPSTAFQVLGATRGQGRTHGDQRTWWRGLRIAERRKTSTFRLLVQVAPVNQGLSPHVASGSFIATITGSYRGDHKIIPPLTGLLGAPRQAALFWM